MTQMANAKANGTQMSSTTAAFCCAAAAFILLVHALSLVLGVLLILAVVLCGILISLALTRRTPQSELTR